MSVFIHPCIHLLKSRHCRHLAFLCVSLAAFLPSPLCAQLLINEVCASNTEVLADEDGDFEDWIELYNAGSDDVNLVGYFISDDADEPLMYSLPDVLLPPGGFLLIWASGKDKVGEEGEIHSNFQISSAGEPILLSTEADGVVDLVPPVVLAANLSYGRQSDGSDAFAYFDAPSPAASNNASTPFDAYLSKPELLTTAGFYTIPFALFAMHADPEAVLRYTLDGSEPTEGSPLYDGPINIENRLGEPDGISAIPTTTAFAPEWYRWFPPMQPVYKGTAVRMKAFRAGAIPSAVTSATYIVDPEVDERYTLPRVALTLPEEAMFGPQGIYTNHLGSGPAWERQAHFELFDSAGVSTFSSDVGLRLHGGNSRRYALKSFRLYFRGSLGEDAMEQAIFPQGSMHHHERILLRNSGSEWSRTYFRDAFAQQLLHGYAHIDYMRYQPAVTFVNGEYWGILNIRERLDDNYIRNHHGYEKHEIDMLENISTAVYGSNADYVALRSFWQSQNLGVAENYAHVEAQVDVDNFRDYHINQIFAMNTDQPGKNVRFWRPKAEGGKWRWMLFDLDDSFAYGPHCDYHRNGLVYCTGLNSVSATTINPVSPTPAWAPNGPGQTLPLRAMVRSPYFRVNFINRFADLLNTAFMPGRLHAMIDAFDAQIAPYMHEHYERWHRPEPGFRAVHLALLHNFAEERKAVMQQDLIDFFELEASYALTVSVTPPQAGHVKVNTIYIHPDSVYIASANAYPWTGTYYAGLPLPIHASAAPGFTFSHWAETGSTDDTLWVDAASAVQYTAVFEPVNLPEPIHYWSFNSSQWQAPTFSVGGGNVSPVIAGNTVFLLDEGEDFEGVNNRLGAETGLQLKAYEPAGSHLIFDIPTTGYKYPVLSYEVRRSGQGAGRHRVLLSTGGAEFALVDSLEIHDDAPILYTLPLGALAGTAHNADLRLKIDFVPGEGGAAGNNRIDNVCIDAQPLSGSNLPPGLVESLFRKELIAGAEPLQLPLSPLLTDPEGDALSYAIDTYDDGAAQWSLNADVLEINGLQAGESQALLSVSDGHNSPLQLGLSVLVHPEAAYVAPFSGMVFTGWHPDEAEGSYPEHMLFVQGATPDPGLHSPLLYAYHIPHDDYHEDDAATLGQPYNNTARSRINGLGEEGISFVNTGRTRDLGGAIAAVNLVDAMESVYVSFAAGTIAPGSREYALRLQFREGITGVFQDLLVDGQPVEYLRNADAAHDQLYLLLPLPDSLLGAPYVQVMWRYYHTGLQWDAEVGARAMLRLDDIVIGHANFDSVHNADNDWGLVLYPNPAVDQFKVFHDHQEQLSAGLYSLDGKLVMSEELRPGITTLHAGDLSAGLYLLVLQNEDGLMARRRVVLLGE